MGNLIWHEWARLVSITAGVYAVWSGYWGCFYRKFFWDFTSCILRDPGGFQPSASALPFAQVIIVAPVLQIITMVIGALILMLELPAPFVKGSAIHRNFVIRIVALLFLTAVAILFYQGTNAAIYSFIAAIGYIRALTLGEEMADAKANRGRGKA